MSADKLTPTAKAASGRRLEDIMKANLGRTWDHDPNHYRFLRQSPKEQENLLFDDPKRKKLVSAAWGITAFLWLAVALAALNCG